MPARQIHPCLWLVGSGTDEDAFTDRYDSHCYLVWDGTTGFLVDAGTGRGADRWLTNIAEVCDPRSLSGLLLTHYHADHAGGAAAARAAGLHVAAHPLTVAALRTGDEEHTQVRRARDAGVYPANYHLPAAEIDELATGRLTLSESMTLDVIDAPGHCDGHLVLLTRLDTAAALLSGDCLFAGGQISLQPIPDCRLDAYAETVIGLADLEPDLLLPGHGDLLLSGAAAVVERAADAFRHMVPPPNLLTPW